MTQTQIAATAFDETPNNNKSVPYGLMKTVEHYLRFSGVLDCIGGLKTRGIPLDKLVVALAVFTMHTSNSMNACAKWLEDPLVRRHFGFSKNEEVSQRTLNRAIEILGQNRETIITALWNGIRERFEIDEYDINVDGSAIVLYGPKAEMGATGYARDKNRGKLQVEFIVAQLAQLGIPIYVKPYKGNVPDEAQYRDCVPELAGLVSGKGIHSLDVMKETTDVPDPEKAATPEERKEADDAMAAIAAVAMVGAAIVADNGAASEENISRMTGCGFGYVTRVKMNAVDDKHIEECKSEFVQLGNGMMCYVHGFRNGKTNYLFFSKELFEMNRIKAEARYDKDLQLYKDVQAGKLRKSDFVKVRRSHWIKVETKVTVQQQLAPLSENDRRRIIRQEIMGPRCGFFKLQSSVRLTPQEALRRYRRRTGIECVISSLKRVTGIKPIRVWNDDSIAGCMMLAVLCEASLAMARYCMKGTIEEKTDQGGGTTIRTVKPNTESMVRSLNHLTLTRFRWGNGPYRVVLSNWEPISEDIFEAIKAHESPDWGSKKVPIAAKRSFPDDGEAICRMRIHPGSADRLDLEFDFQRF